MSVREISSTSSDVRAWRYRLILMSTIIDEAPDEGHAMATMLLEATYAIIHFDA